MTWIQVRILLSLELEVSSEKDLQYAEFIFLKDTSWKESSSFSVLSPWLTKQSFDIGTVKLFDWSYANLSLLSSGASFL